MRSSSTSTSIVQVVQQRARLGVEARRATPSASSSIARSGSIVTSTARKCAIHFSSTRHSASSAGRPRFRLIDRSWRSSRSQ